MKAPKGYKICDSKAPLQIGEIIIRDGAVYDGERLIELAGHNIIPIRRLPTRKPRKKKWIYENMAKADYRT